MADCHSEEQRDEESAYATALHIGENPKQILHLRFRMTPRGVEIWTVVSA
jgi:hypothetical protein